MTGKRMRLLALFLAVSLFVSPFSKIQLYAAETGDPLETEEGFSEAASETEIWAETERETISEIESESVTESATESETEIMTKDELESETDSETGTEYTTESETENMTEATTETESVTESETEITTEDELESETETEPQLPTKSDYQCPGQLEPDDVPYDENQTEFTQKLVRRTRNELPAEYDARKEGYLPEVRNQNPWGACWCFSLLGAMEVSAIRDMGMASDKTDLSERHLAYFGYNTGYDALGNANGDTISSPADYYLVNGGNDRRGATRLMNWNGGAREEDYPYPSDKVLPAALERETAQDAAFYLENAYSYNFAAAVKDGKKADAIKVVKQMIIDYGAVSWSYYDNGTYLNSETNAYYNNEKQTTGHAIMAVGWDDNYPKENFLENRRPENDGAWIIRNSWGKSSRDNGYFYISYEDVSLGSGNPVYAFTVCDSAKYDNNYFYGNTANGGTIAVRRAAQVFRIKGKNAEREKLTAVSFYIGTSEVDYELQIYKNPDMENGKVVNPTSGIPMLDTLQKGKTGYPGLQTIEIETPVTIDADDYVSVVLTFPETRPSIYFDRSGTSSGNKENWVHNLAEGRSFYSFDKVSWTDNYANNRTFRINALTVDCDDVVKDLMIKKTDVMESRGFHEIPQITIQWTKCTGVEKYRLYRSEDGENYELIYTADQSVREYVDILPERREGQWYYKVEAVYSDKVETSSAVSQEVKGIIEAPKLKLSSYDGYQAVFTWNEVSGAEQYELWKISDKGSEDGAEKIADFSVDDERSYTINTDGWELGNYYYKIRAVCGGLQTIWSEVCINRNLVWKQNSYYEAYFEWLPVEGAASYALYRKVNERTFVTKNIKGTSKTCSMKDTQENRYLPCDEYQFYVKAYDKAGNEIQTSVSSTIAVQMTLPPLNVDNIEYDYATAITITWSGGFGTEKVAIYRSENPLYTGELVAEVDMDTTTEAKGVSYQDSVCKGKTYWYQLIPIVFKTNGSRVEGQVAATDKISTKVEAATLETAQYTEGNGVHLAWNAAKGAEGYLIERSDNQNGYVVLAAVENGDAITYTDQSVEAGNQYRYRVLSYFASESGSRETVPATSVLVVEILPKPVEFSTVTELKRDASDKQNNRTRVALSWNVSEKVQSYAIYRSTVSDNASNSYACVAENITEGQYTDNTAVPDTSYSYKLVAISNGLSSELEKTETKTITLKPALAALEMSAENLEIIRDTKQAFKITPKPAHYPYKQELVWSAYDEDKNILEIVQKNGTLIINGVDGREVFYLENDSIYAVCASETVKVTLVAAIDEISAKCDIFVYNNDFWVRGVKDLTYTGGALTQDIEVYNGNRLLEEGVDYTVSYKNNVKVSSTETKESKKPAIIVKGKGNYAGTQTIYFEILPEPAADVGKISLIKAKVKSIGKFEYQGTAIEPKPIVKVGSKTLIEGTDYILSYINNEGAGKATVVISGINDYKGTKKVNFTVNYNIQKDDARLMRVMLDTQDVPYMKNGAKPTLHVYCGSRLLREGMDYKISYKNNKAIATTADKKAPKVVITGKGNYKGKQEVAFNIVKQDIGELTLTAKDKVYSQKAGNFTTSFAITDKDGKKLSAGKDYDKQSVVYTYADTGGPVEKTDIVPQGTKLCISVKTKETSAYYGIVSGVYRITAYDIGKAKVTVAPQIYTGSAIRPDSGTGVKVTYKGRTAELTEGVDYEITDYANNDKKGTAKLYVKGLGDFGGTKTVNFKIKKKTFQWWWKD